MRRLNDFLYGFFACFFIFTVAVLVQSGRAKQAQIYQTHATPQQVDEEFANAYAQARFELWTTTPAALAMDRGQAVLYYDGGTFVKFYTRLGNNRYSLRWTLDN